VLINGKVTLKVGERAANLYSMDVKKLFKEDSISIEAGKRVSYVAGEHSLRNINKRRKLRPLRRAEFGTQDSKSKRQIGEIIQSRVNMKSLAVNALANQKPEIKASLTRFNKPSIVSEFEIEKEGPCLLAEKSLWKPLEELKAGDCPEIIVSQDSLIATITPKIMKKFNKNARNLECSLRLKGVFSGGILTMLQQIDFLSALNKNGLEVLSNALKYQVLAPGEVLFKEGSTGSEFYMVYQGEVDITKEVTKIKRTVASVSYTAL